MKNREHAAGAQCARTSRREFAKTVAAALVSAPLIAATPPAGASAQEKPPAAAPAPTPAAATAAAAAAQQNAPSPLAEAYAEAARLRFGEKLKPEELARLKRDIEGNVRTAARLRAFKLVNADEPDFIFVA